MTKFQFFLVSTLLTSVILLLMGNRDGNSLGSLLPVSVIVALSYLGNRYISENIWESFAGWANRVTNRRLFRTRAKRLPPSKLRRLR